MNITRLVFQISQRLMTSRYNGDENKKDVHEADVTFLQNCRRAALYVAERQGWKIVPCASGSQPLSIEQIHNTVIDLVKEELQNA